MARLTKKQKQVFDYIVDYINENQFSPTQVEIQKHFGFKSLGSVQDYIRYLKGAGLLDNDPNAVRGLVPIRPEESLTFSANSARQEREIPMLGEVAAGRPIEAIEGNESICVSQSLLGKGDFFALTVTGNSMIDDGILDGDIIIVKKTHTANNGDTVIATINNEATLKRYYRKKEKIELHPANKEMSPIIISSGNFEIKGILQALMRRF